tara:strand:- start:24 stop:170 length:147 start_codon:yes stop_codon:yes gene_type:complete
LLEEVFEVEKWVTLPRKLQRWTGLELWMLDLERRVPGNRISRKQDVFF